MLMTVAFEGIPKVAIQLPTKADHCLFIAAELTAKTGEVMIVIRSDLTSSNHKGIFNKLVLSVQNRELQVKCLGGGLVLVYPDSNLMAIGQESDEYGMEPDRPQTFEMFQEFLPKFKVVHMEP